MSWKQISIFAQLPLAYIVFLFFFFFYILQYFWPISAKRIHLLDSTKNSSHTCWWNSQVFPGDDEPGAEANFDAELSDPHETSMLINEISGKAILL